MKLARLPLALRTATLAGAASLLLAGCLAGNDTASASQDTDGQAAYMTSELDQMGQVYGQAPEAAAGKASALGITVTGELVVEPFAFHDDCKCLVRRATYTGMKGFERERIDSVTLYDSAGGIMDRFRPAHIAKIVHSRNVTKAKGAREADIRFDLTVEIKGEPGLKKGVWNGTMTGSYDGEEFKSGAVTQVVRAWENGRFGFPESGTLFLERPVFRLLAEFLGDDKAKVTLTNKVTHKVRVLWVDADYRETEPAAAP